jgi:hypothetical protein
MPIEIKDAHGRVLATVDADSLVGADLSHRDLRGANLSGCDLRGAHFISANLENADLRGALLTQSFPGANLRGTLLDGCVIPWNDRALVSELLRRAADTPARAAYAVRGAAQAVGVQPANKACWRDLYAERHPEAEWAIGVLARYVKDGDNAPDFLKQAAEALAKKTAAS